MRKFLRRVFFLSPALTIAISTLGFGLLIGVALSDIQNPIIRDISFFLSAYALVVSITGISRYIKSSIENAKENIKEKMENSSNERVSKLARSMGDVKKRTAFILLITTLINGAYIIIKLSFGIIKRDSFAIALSVYYAILVGIKISLLSGIRKDKIDELKRYKFVGCTLLILNQAMTAICVIAVNSERSYNYPEPIVYMMAFYTFYLVISAIRNLVKYRKYHSPLLSSVKAVSLVQAMMSLLSLTSVMIFTFSGVEDNSIFERAMMSSLAAVICLIEISIAIYMVVRSSILLKRERSPQSA